LTGQKQRKTTKLNLEENDTCDLQACRCNNDELTNKDGRKRN
jgi:hypothetical protein